VWSGWINLSCYYFLTNKLLTCPIPLNLLSSLHLIYAWFLLHLVLNLFRLELCSFGISVTTVAPGAITSNLGNSSLERYNKIADWKYYKSFESALRARTEVSQGPKSTAADVFSKKVVALVLKRNPPPWFSYGRFSTILAVLYYLPLFVRDYFYRKVMKC
jgi:hypothetical protein